MSDFDEIFFKMQVISVAFRMGMCRFGEMETELLGCQEGRCGGTSFDYSKKINETYRQSHNFLKLKTF
jgi:hypothetical protein